MGKRSEREEDEGGVGKRRKVEAAAADTIDDLDNLDCLICRHPLRPPIFQCTVGHKICSSCHDKLADKCCFCSDSTVYSRCHELEHVVESTKVACPNGCTARIRYYQKEEHEKECQHAPCFCPEPGCSFSGPTAMLLEHLSAEHEPPTKITYNEKLGVVIPRDAPGSVFLVGEDGHLFLVNMEMEPAGGVVSVCCVQPHNTRSVFKCRLSISCTETGYSQAAEFQTRGTNLCDGMPKDDFMFLVPKVLLRRATTTTTIMRVTLTPQ